MAFTDLVKQLAAYRQSKWDGWGSWCAKCGTGLAGKKVETVQRTPAEKGGKWDVDNCVILCPDCFLDADIKIYSINGKLLYAGKIYENYKIIEIKQYNVGMYILKVESPGGCIIRKIIKE